MELPFAVIADERRAIADLIATLTPAQLSTPSLCGAWTVQDVATHLLVGPTASIGEFLGVMVRARGRFPRANDLMVDNRRHLDRDALAAELRRVAQSRFTPPGFDWHAPLADLRVHALDITVPLGLTLAVPREPWGEVLEFLLTRKAVGAFVPKGRPPLAVRATDLGWSGGEAGAPEVAGPAAALGAALCGRTALLDDLEGPGAEAISRWLRA